MNEVKSKSENPILDELTGKTESPDKSSESSVIDKSKSKLGFLQSIIEKVSSTGEFFKDLLERAVKVISASKFFSMIFKTFGVDFNDESKETDQEEEKEIDFSKIPEKYKKLHEKLRLQGKEQTKFAKSTLTLYANTDKSKAYNIYAGQSLILTQQQEGDFYKVKCLDRELFMHKDSLSNLSDTQEVKVQKAQNHTIYGDSIAQGVRSHCTHGQGFEGKRIQDIYPYIVHDLATGNVKTQNITCIMGYNNIPSTYDDKKCESLKNLFKKLIQDLRNLAIAYNKKIYIALLFTNSEQPPQYARAINQEIIKMTQEDPYVDAIKTQASKTNEKLHDGSFYQKFSDKLDGIK